MSSGIPLGLAAGLELSALFLTADDSGSAVQALLRSYEGLTHGEWALEESQHEFFRQQVDDLIAELALQDEAMPSYQSALNMLREEDTRQRETTKRLLAFQEHAARGLLAPVRSRK